MHVISKYKVIWNLSCLIEIGISASAAGPASSLELTRISVSLSPCEIYISITVSIDQLIYQRLSKIPVHLSQHL